MHPVLHFSLILLALPELTSQIRARPLRAQLVLLTRPAQPLPQSLVPLTTTPLLVRQSANLLAQVPTKTIQPVLVLAIRSIGLLPPNASPLQLQLHR